MQLSASYRSGTKPLQRNQFMNHVLVCKPDCEVGWHVWALAICYQSYRPHHPNQLEGAMPQQRPQASRHINLELLPVHLGGSLFDFVLYHGPARTHCSGSPAFELAEDPIPRLFLFLVC